MGLTCILNWHLQAAQPIRFMLEYTGTEYEDQQYDIGPAPDFNRENWLSKKFTLGLQLPNVSTTVLFCGR